MNNLQISSYLDSQIATELNLVSLQTCYVVHINTSFAVRLNINQRRNGKRTPFSLAYSGDTLPSKNFRKLGMYSTLLIHEATFDDSFRIKADKSRHCTISQAIEQCSEMKPAYAVLTHFSQRYIVPLIDQALPRNFGIAFDNMELVESDLPLLNPIFSTIKTMYNKQVEQYECNASVRNDEVAFIDRLENAERNISEKIRGV